jgi:hypothetical protein
MEVVMVEFILTRKQDDGLATRGELHAAPAPNFQCFTLERSWKNNEPNVSCIPPGEYPLRLRDDLGWAKKLGRPVVEIYEVPGRSLILVHPANWWWDLKGCMAPGMTPISAEDGSLAVGASRNALDRIEPALHDAAARGASILVTAPPR